MPLTAHKMTFSQGRGGAGEGWGTQVSTTQLTPAEPPKVYCVASGHLLDSPGNAKNAPIFLWFPKRRKQRRSLTAWGRHLAFPRDIHTDVSGMFPSDIPGLLL